MRFSVLLLGAVALLGETKAPAHAGADQPNVLFVYLDDFGWRDTGYMGSDFYETPHLDRLARDGVIFTEAYSPAANCAPARASLMSGQYTPRHRIFNVGTGPRGKSEHRRLLYTPGVDTLAPEVETWAERLQEVGYTTASIGKWHLSRDPRSYGFDINIGGSHSGSPPRGYYPPHPRAPGLENAAEGEYLTDRLSDEAVQFIRQNRDHPWCLYLTHFAVHTPLDAKRELVPKYRDKEPGELHDHVPMATMIQAVDDGIGRIQTTLDELALTEKTIIVFFSDNGGLASATDMAPLRGHKGTYYEGGIRVPMFIKWPGVVEPGTTIGEPVIGVDLYPTFCDFVGAALPDAQPIDGVSLVPLLRGEVDALGPRSLFWHFPAYLEARRGIEGRESRDPLFRSRPLSVIRSGHWKLHQSFEDGSLELYNLRDDVGEQHNLAEQHPEKAQELLARLQKWQSDTRAPIPVELNPEYDAASEAAAIGARSR